MLLVIVIVIAAVASQSGGDDDPTEVVNRATESERDEEREPTEDVEEATETPSESVELSGKGEDKQDHFVRAGTYSVEALCDNVAMQVYINDQNGDQVAWPVNRSRLNEPANDAVIPADDEYEFEVYCGGTVGDGDWSIGLTPKD